jgi:hypothetical protein
MDDDADGFYTIMYNENVLSPVMDDSRSSLGNKSLFPFFCIAHITTICLGLLVLCPNHMRDML